MIKKTGKGFVVENKEGTKALSKPTTKAKAEGRLKQIEYFKHKKK